MGVYILLDRSGSMAEKGLWNEALGSINGYVEKLPNDTDVTVAVFDSVGYDIVRDVKKAFFEPLSNRDAVPRGGTPLLDATARMIWRMQDKNDDRSILVIMTDGEENQSRFFKKYDVVQLVAEVRAKNWEVIFLGANFDKVGEQARSVGLDLSKSVNISPGNMQSYTRGLVADKSLNYLSVGAAMSFSAEEQALAVNDASAMAKVLRNEKSAG